ncbi:MAG: ATP-binding protein, partial [Patescibacteria group bacterium]
MAKQKDYDAGSIQVLEGLEPVRKRPGMYIGSTGIDGLHHMIKEVADNGIDEAIAGHATTVSVLLLNDGGVRIEDDGRGIPVEKHPKTGVSTLETVLTILHAGGKFDGKGYKVSSGLHGVCVSVVNELSIKFLSEVYLDGFEYRREFSLGSTLAPIKKIVS